MGQGHRSWYENGKLNGDYYYHAKSERSWLHSLWEKTNIKAFVCEQSSNDCWGIVEDCFVTKNFEKYDHTETEVPVCQSPEQTQNATNNIPRRNKELENRSMHSNRVNDWWLSTNLQNKLCCMSDEDITSQSNEAKYIYLWPKVRGHQYATGWSDRNL